VVVLGMDAMVSFFASISSNNFLKTGLFMVVPLSQFPDLFGEKIQDMVHTRVFLIQLVEHMLLTFSNVLVIVTST
jgi:hypothetical protein